MSFLTIKVPVGMCSLTWSQTLVQLAEREDVTSLSSQHLSLTPTGTFSGDSTSKNNYSFLPCSAALQAHTGA